MIPLEQRYRSLLRWLPASYRRQWEDDMVATFLATTVPDDPQEAEYVEHCGRPSRDERASILRLAVRLRLGGVGDPPHARAWGDAVRRATLVGLLANTIGSFGALWRTVWFSDAWSWLPLPDGLREFVDTAGSPGIWHVMLEMLALLWLVAFVAVVVGRRRVAAITGVLACVPTAVGVVGMVRLAVTDGFLSLVPTTVAMAIVTVLPLAGLAAFHAQSPPVARRPWLTALAVTAAFAAVPAYLSLVPVPYVVDWAGLLSVGVVGAAVVHVARRGPAGPDLRWTLALAIVATVVGTLRAVTLLDVLAAMDGTVSGPLLQVGAVQLLVVVGVGGALWRRATQDLRDLPVAGSRPAPPDVAT